MKHFYLHFVKVHISQLFPQAVSYNKFVELVHEVTLPMTIFLKTCCMGKSTGISFIDSTSGKIRAIHKQKYDFALPLFPT